MIDYIFRASDAPIKSYSPDKDGYVRIAIGDTSAYLSTEEVDALIDFLTKHKSK